MVNYAVASILCICAIIYRLSFKLRRNQVANTTLFKDTPIAPISLNGVSQADESLQGKLDVQIQFDPKTSNPGESDDLYPGCCLYYRVDESEAAITPTFADMEPEGYLTAGGDVEFHIDPKANETPTLHLLLTDKNRNVIVGGELDSVLITAYRANPD